MFRPEDIVKGTLICAIRHDGTIKVLSIVPRNHYMDARVVRNSVLRYARVEATEEDSAIVAIPFDDKEDL